MKTAVRALRGPFARKHSRWILIAALKWKHPGRVGEVARKVLEQREAKTLPRILRLRQRNARNSGDRKSTRLNSSHVKISYAVFCLKKKKKNNNKQTEVDHRAA